MAAPIDENVVAALRGVMNANTRLPKPLLIKIYISSIKEEFRQERRILLELIGPELQSFYDDRQIEIEIVDMHFGTGPEKFSQIEQDPYVLKEYLHEIETSHATSKSVFFLALMGDSIGRMHVPTHIDEDIYAVIMTDDKISAEELCLLDKWYVGPLMPSGVKKRLRAQYVLKDDYRFIPPDKWHDENIKLCTLLERSLPYNLQAENFSEDFMERVQKLRRTQIELEIQKALELSNDKILTVFREWSTQQQNIDSDITQRLRKLKELLTMNLLPDNHTTLVQSHNFGVPKGPEDAEEVGGLLPTQEQIQPETYRSTEDFESDVMFQMGFRKYRILKEGASSQSSDQSATTSVRADKMEARKNAEEVENIL